MNNEMRLYNILKMMRIEKIGLLVTLVCFSLFWCFFSSCRIRRQTTGSFRSDRTDSLSLTYADSLWSSRLQHLSGHTRLQWRHIRLSPPDSAGFQYPLSVSDANLDREEEKVQQDSVRRITRRQSTAKQQENREEEQHRLQENTVPSFRLTALLFGTDLFLLGAITWVVWRRKRGKK